MDEILVKKIKEFGELPSNQSLNDKSFNIDGYTTAIKRAVRDLTPRTLTPIKNNSSKLLVDDLLDGSENSFLSHISRFFDDPEKDFYSVDTVFDEWHTKRCSEILTIIRNYYKTQKGEEVCYGKAQKIVNITLKGCYCLQGAEDKKNHFKYCHMALDSFTLAWYNRSVKKEDKVYTPWSNLTKEEYSKIETVIRTIKLTEPAIFENLTPLQMEFLVWPLEIMVNTVKTVNDCFGGMIEEDYTEKYFEINKMKNDLIMAELILGKKSYEDIANYKDFIPWLYKESHKVSRKKSEAAQFIINKYGLDNEKQNT